RRNAQLVQLAQQPVLTAGQPLVELLHRVELAGVGDEADDVPRDPALADLDDPLVDPLLDRLPPRQGEQAGGGIGRRGEDEAHASMIAWSSALHHATESW